MPALAAEPGRRLCQDLWLGLQAAHLFAQLLELAALFRAQRARLGNRACLPVRAHHRHDTIGQGRQPPRPLHPSRNRLLGAAKLLREIDNPATVRIQFRDLLPKRRRLRRPGLSTHVGLLSVRIIESVRKNGVTSVLRLTCSWPMVWGGQLASSAS